MTADEKRKEITSYYLPEAGRLLAERIKEERYPSAVIFKICHSALNWLKQTIWECFCMNLTVCIRENNEYSISDCGV